MMPKIPEIQFTLEPEVTVEYTYSEMSKRKRFQKLLSGSKNIRFSEATACIESFGFRLARINGSHHIFVHQDIPELVNLQEVKGQAKPYQVKQFLKIVERYNLQLENEG